MYAQCRREDSRLFNAMNLLCFPERLPAALLVQSRYSLHESGTPDFVDVDRSDEKSFFEFQLQNKNKI